MDNDKNGFFKSISYYMTHLAEIENKFERVVFILAVIGCPATIAVSLLSAFPIFSSLTKMGLMLCVFVLVYSIIQRNKHKERITPPISLKLSIIGLAAGFSIYLISQIIRAIILIVSGVSTIANAIANGSSILDSWLELFQKLFGI